ncbi:bifunctional hydroxymethylpyrimidine kinase/phosphomethylpyrimidine kinase [Microlunatus capsulatus]|uniref:Hydroxymethylpyrimidine/phosphomethylpyrimidine kinase n=1 Tax=Microlunatus capsulatus TaxID=99117 RepID=A0ABS4Z7E1_9ACTN|nr:bifunctional hydroxymethylpyrimidine kinase/phosphomethylpyrimidine kinase [Microlunatus capsulatus]MBP2416637.1 hydroxymethylpyrimidine/phosphomethylpyrimidine kinase [Microlunatus capsulatus]
MTVPVPTVLTIAGTDPSGGAGVAADLKTFAALGAYGTLVVTAVTAQSTRGVDAVHQLDGSFVEQQLETLLADVRVDAVKIGMLGTAGVTRAVAAVLRRHRLRHVVLDPVMVATSGDRLLAADAVAALRDELLPLADLVTPNLPEAADLLGVAEARDEEEQHAQAVRLAGVTARVLLKGGHLGGPESVDLLAEGDAVVRLAAPRVDTTSTHGTGCTLSSAVAALRPAAPDWETAVRGAKGYLTAALRAADRLDVGTGHGPVHHFHALWP